MVTEMDVMEDDILSSPGDLMSDVCSVERGMWELPLEPNTNEGEFLPEDMQFSEEEHKRDCINEVLDSMKIMKLYTNPIEYNFHLYKMIKVLKKIKQRQELELKKGEAVPHFNEFGPLLNGTHIRNKTRSTNLQSNGSFHPVNAGRVHHSIAQTNGVANFSRSVNQQQQKLVRDRPNHNLGNNYHGFNVGSSCPSEIVNVTRDRPHNYDNNRVRRSPEQEIIEEMEEEEEPEVRNDGSGGGYTSVSVISQRNNTAMSRSVFNSCTDAQSSKNVPANMFASTLASIISEGKSQISVKKIARKTTEKTAQNENSSKVVTKASAKNAVAKSSRVKNKSPPEEEQPSSSSSKKDRKASKKKDVSDPKEKTKPQGGAKSKNSRRSSAANEDSLKPGDKPARKNNSASMTDKNVASQPEETAPKKKRGRKPKEKNENNQEESKNNSKSSSPAKAKSKSKSKANSKVADIPIASKEQNKKKKDGSKNGGNKKEAVLEDIFAGIEQSCLLDTSLAPMSPGNVLNSAKKCWGEVSSGRQTPPTSMLGHFREMGNCPSQLENPITSSTDINSDQPNNRKKLVQRVANDSKPQKKRKGKTNQEVEPTSADRAWAEEKSNEIERIMAAAKLQTIRTPTILKEVFRGKNKHRPPDSSEPDDSLDEEDTSDDSASVG